MLTSDLDYDLPPELLATVPAEPRDAARLLVVHRNTGQVEHRHVRDLACASPPLPSEGEGRGEGLLRPGDLLVFNDSQVIPARFEGVRRGTGGRVRGLYLASPDAHEPARWQVLLEARGTLRQGECITLPEGAELELLTCQGGGQWLAQVRSPLDTLALLSRIGAPPLPPYIRKARRARHEPELLPTDAERYNTVYAAAPGSVAAPTAGLHFTPELLEALDRRGVQRATVTLHVGLGTFAPVRTPRLEDHAMHAEWMSVPAATLRALDQARTRGARIVPVGTTTVRALESLPQPLPAGDFAALTRLFITPAGPGAPGFGFRFADVLLTNFHLPRSTLLALVAAIPGVGLDRLNAWYRLAIEQRYRFYSYGDAMLIV